MKKTHNNKQKENDNKIYKVVKDATVKTNKTQKIKEHLISKRTITSWQAIEKYAATRLAAIICVLRENGWIIDSADVSFEDRYGNKGTYAKYTLISEPRKAKKK